MSVSVPALPNTRGGVCRSTMNQGEVSMTQRELERSTSRRGWTVRWPLWIAYGSFMRFAKSFYSLATAPGSAALAVGANAALQRAGHVPVVGSLVVRRCWEEESFALTPHPAASHGGDPGTTP